MLSGKSGSQPTITSVLAKRVCDDRRAEGITQRICNMVEKDMMPISTVDSEGFRELINFLEPGYRIPSRGTITTRIEARFNESKAELKTQLATTNVALTTDCWSALTTESYITVTCHYIEQNWQVKSAVLLTESMSVRHTADNLAEKLNQSMESWGLTGRVIACVHDNARNIVSAKNPTRMLGVLELRDEYWQLIEDVAPVLAALKCTTTVMSAETEVSISNAYPITFSLINTHLMRVQGDSSKVAEFKSKVRTSLATMLDPRHKHLGFLTPTRRIPGNSILLELAVAEDVSSTTDEASRTRQRRREGDTGRCGSPGSRASETHFCYGSTAG
ncbi:hypothetical protein SKAU_G00208730 [Synaphobranchus kaupii]|uniref:Uncharacterized protein n=1 Tax=Synaphobranchus kaupii TaxID=118154 RepID=A0A9Q1F8E9_SYNKA|nr:hypothetical protein SKAU_G00208730 [Synaphobranchus kaupii]